MIIALYILIVSSKNLMDQLRTSIAVVSFSRIIPIVTNSNHKTLENITLIKVFRDKKLPKGQQILTILNLIKMSMFDQVLKF